MNREQVIEQLPGLRRYARALTGDAWAADDLVQDTLERACAKWRLWVVGTDLRAWLFTLMHNLYLNQRRGLQATTPTTPLEDAEHELPAAGTAPVDEALDLDRCLQRLPAEQRAVLLMVTIEDMSYDATAKVLGVPLGTVMSRLSRARTRLRELMDGAALAGTGTLPSDPARPAAAPVLRRLK